MKTMKKIALYAILQGIVVFLITGLITQLIRGDFFFRNLAPIFGVLAAIMRFGTASLMKILAPTLYDEEAKQEKSLEKHLSDRLYGKIEGRILVWRVKIQ